MQWNTVAFFLFSIGIWLTVTTTLAYLSGWFRLMEAYPDCPSEPVLRLRGQGGTMGSGVRMSGILTLSVCAPGLRVGMTRLFGLFCRDFLVPWENITVARKATLFGPAAKLQFGNPVVGTLQIPSHIADRLANAAMERWPESGPIAIPARGDIARRLLRECAIYYAFFATFFIAVGRVTGQHGPPILVAILFPAVITGLMFAVRFFIERR
jgi:hypothetical protein